MRMFGSDQVRLAGWILCLFSAVSSTDMLWIRDAQFDNLTSITGYGVRARSRLDCGRSCAANTSCISFSFASGQDPNCQLLATILSSTESLQSTPNSIYYIPNGAVSPFVCPPDDTIFRTETLSDGSNFTYRRRENKYLCGNGIREKVIRSKVDQATALMACSNLGGFLARVTTVAKMNLLLLLLKCPGYENEDYYVDGSNPSGTWQTNNGDLLPMGNEFWCSYCPDGGSALCLRMAEHNDYKLNDCSCSTAYFYICEKTES